MAKNIKTGVDKLIDIVSDKKKIELSDAAKELGVGKEVVQEWAEFLEQEGIISIEYTLSKIWLKEKKITHEDIFSSAKEIMSEKDAFLRKIDVTLKAIDNESTGFEEIKKHFVDIQSHIKNEIDTVKKELSELEKYDSLKKNLTKDIEEDKHGFEELLKKYAATAKQEEDKYDSLLKGIDEQKKVIDSFAQKVEYLKKLRDDFQKTIANSRTSLDNVEKTLREETKNFENATRKLSDLKKLTSELISTTSAKRDKLSSEFMSELKSRSGGLLARQEDLYKKSSEKLSKLNDFVETNRKVYDSFKGFFMRNIDTEKMIKQIDTEREDLRKSLESLRDKIEKFSLMSKTTSVKEQFADIEKDLKELEKRRAGLRISIDKLIDFIKGTNP